MNSKIFAELHIENPITKDSIEQLFNDIEACDTLLLIINSGTHEFESIEVLKELKLRFMKEEGNLKRFRKIAFIHPPGLNNSSDDKDRYNYFSNREEAMDWLFSEETW